jgi:hypothetical protein
MIMEAEEVLNWVKIALQMLPHVIDVPITDDEIVEVAEQAPPGPQLHSAFVAREFILERMVWIALGDQMVAEAALASLARANGCQVYFAEESFVFLKQREAELPLAITRPAESAGRTEPCVLPRAQSGRFIGSME